MKSILIALTLCVACTFAFTPAQWQAAYNMPTLTFLDNWPYQTAIVTTPAADIWKIFRIFGCSVSLLSPGLKWTIVDGPYKGVSSANPTICANPPVTTDVGVTYNISLPGVTDYLLKVISVDDYNRQRCFQLNGPGAFPGVEAILYTSCSKITPLPVGPKNYTLYQIWAMFGLPAAGTLPDNVGTIEQRDLFNGFFTAETTGITAQFGDAFPTCTASVSIALQGGSYKVTVQNTGQKYVNSVQVTFTVDQGATLSCFNMNRVGTTGTTYSLNLSAATGSSTLAPGSPANSQFGCTVSSGTIVIGSTAVGCTDGCASH